MATDGLRLQKLASFDAGRPETGPMQFGNDWPGVFIRGDNALLFAGAIEAAIEHVPHEHIARLKRLADTLRSCRAGSHPADDEQKE